MHTFCVERKLAEIIRPYLPDSVWGQTYLAKDIEEVQSAKFRGDQYRRLEGYECFYAGKKSDVRAYGIRYTGCKPEFCELCGQMYGLVWPEDAFILDVDWAGRSAGLKNGNSLLLSQSLYERVAWKDLKPVTVTPIPVVARVDLPAKVQKAHWGSVEKTVVSLSGRTPKSRISKSRAVVRLIYNDTVELPEPTAVPTSEWKRKAMTHWCCGECGRQRVATAGQKSIALKSIEPEIQLPGVPDSPVVRIHGTRLMMYHRDIVRALRNMKKDLLAVTATHVDGAELPYAALVGLPRVQIEATGDTPSPCATCGLASTVDGSGQLRAAETSVGKHAVMQDPDGWLCLPETRLHRFQKAIGAPLADQLSEQWITVA
ncbi:MAG: hypothetical protein GIKADHBN_02478 [Phycisphaerales bacterium]|nr:hypothetical protein [Phycisphaerales bacterium]